MEIPGYELHESPYNVTDMLGEPGSGKGDPFTIYHTETAKPTISFFFHVVGFCAFEAFSAIISISKNVMLVYYQI